MMTIVGRRNDNGQSIRVGYRLISLAILILLQAASATFFVGDVFADYLAIGMDAHTSYEALAVVALILGVLFGAAEMWRTVSRGVRAEYALKMARKVFSEMIEERFSAWSLTDAEAEVALLTLKGFDINEIGVFRNTADGTVRAQLARIYAKSGWHNRGQFVSSFIDDLMESPVHMKASAGLP
jgi:DNA-binding CsgD family transcriptional regulator